MDKPRPVWPWIVAALLLPLLYVASFGPMCWAIRNRLMSSARLFDVYRPCVVLASDGPTTVSVATHWWARTCGAERTLRIAVLAIEPLDLNVDDRGSCFPFD